MLAYQQLGNHGAFKNWMRYKRRADEDRVIGRLYCSGGDEVFQSIADLMEWHTAQSKYNLYFVDYFISCNIIYHSFTTDRAYPLTDIQSFPRNKGATYWTLFFSFAILRGVIEYSVLEKGTFPTKNTF